MNKNLHHLPHVYLPHVYLPHVYWQSPLGLMFFAANDKGIAAIDFVDTKEHLAEPSVPPENQVLAEAVTQMKEYFRGTRKRFDLPLAPQGTEFQRKVWAVLMTIDYAHTASYLDIAIALANHKAVRAVGAANGKNPIAIVVPCHRVIGSNGTLTGYAGGLERKQWLLDHEAGATPLDFSGQWPPI